LTSSDGVAAWLDDIPRAYAQIDWADDDWIAEAAQRELRGRMGVSDARSVFGDAYRSNGASVGSTPCDVLIPLNQSYDTAALGRHRVFADQTDWLVQTVAWVLEHTNGAVVVRRHPVERRPDQRSADEYGELLRRRFGESPRLHYVDEQSALSTYE